MKQRKIAILIASVLGVSTVHAQTPEDVLRFSLTNPKGSARSMAIGGAMGSLGGDIQANFINPAGLGFYKTNEFVLSPNFLMNKNKAQFRGDHMNSSKNLGNLGTTGFVFSYNDRFSNLNSKAFSIAINRTADFNNKISYRGLNDFSSLSEQFAEEFASSRLPIDGPLTNAAVSLGTKLAVYSYYIDTATVNGNIEVVGAPLRKSILDGTDYLIEQQKDMTTKGGISEIALSFAGNSNDKFYIGGSIGIPIMNYQRTTRFTESSVSGIADSSFSSVDYTEELSSKGVGFNGKFGIIFKPTNQARVGVAVHTPTIFGIKENIRATMTTITPKYTSTVNERDIYENQSPPTTRFDVVAPWKFLVSGSYLFSEGEDTRRQLGFLTADVEYVTYSSTRFSDANDAYLSENSYYTDLNNVVKDYYKGAINFRVGGEVKFHTFMARAGYAYYGNPYTDENLKNTRQLLSGGVGYRDHGIFIDLTYVHNMSKDADFPYRLGDKANTFAAINSTFNNLALTFGIKF